VAFYFFDTSALVKRYVDEVGSPWVRSLSDPGAGNVTNVLSISGVEAISAITRRCRGGSLRVADAVLAISRLKSDLTAVFRVSQLATATIQRAMDVAEKDGLRGYDAVQLAGALELADRAASLGAILTLVSSDAELNVAATAHRLAVEDPNAHP
jgi:predicted nucleic acid-binding protein